jgi:FKBP-type peptidyl-prolyl cis-trans isomerase FkpA
MKKILYTIALLSALAFNAGAQAVQRTAKGALCQVITNNAGQKIKQNDVVTFQAIQKTDKDSVLFSSYQQGQPVKVQVHPSTNIGDLMDVFPLLGANDSAVVKVPVDSIFKGHETEMPPFFKKGGNIVFEIKILQVQTLAEAMAERDAAMAKIKAEGTKVKAAESATIANYIKSNNIVTKVTPSGLQYVIKSAGIKAKPQTGDTVYVNYTGRTLDGKVFDSSIAEDAKAGGLAQPGRNYEPISFALGTGRVIPGWDEGLALLNEGSKARFIIPSDLAYGERGSGPGIKPYSTLLFDIELVKVVRVKHTATPAAKARLKRKAPLKKRTGTKKKN